MTTQSSLVVLLAVEDPQNSQEQVDNVKVQADGGGDLLLDVVLAHDELCVDEDVGAEDEGGDAAVDELAGGAVGEEGGHEAEEDEAPEGAEEVGHPGGEVVLCLAGEEGEEDEDAGGEDDCVEDDFGLVEGDDDGDGVGLGEGEEAEEEEVCRVGLALPVGEEHEDYGAEELCWGVSMLAVANVGVGNGGRENVRMPRRGLGGTGSMSCSSGSRS